jgi:L-ascorbate metabolism protein UlaG (beta-lactamase superfamily)
VRYDLNMRITKLGHCCLLIETKGKRILTDPGAYSIKVHLSLTNIDFVLFTHDHADHFHLESLKGLLVANPQMQIYANTSVGELLDKEGIEHTVVQDGGDFDVGGVALQGIGMEHAVIHSSMPTPANTGFFVDEKLWYPGDAFTDPKRPVDILALPVAGPWMQLSDGIDYALRLKPRACFPVHDGMLRPDRMGPVHVLTEKVLGENGIEFIPMVEGSVHEF